MEQGRLMGQIELIDVTGETLAVAGWVEAAQGRGTHSLSLLHEDLELSRTALPSLAGGNWNAARLRRQNFAFRVPLPVGLDDLQSIAVTGPARSFRIVPDAQTQFEGALPRFLGFDDMTGSEFRDWSPRRRRSDAGARRILFHAGLVDGAVQGLAVDLDDPDRVLSFEAMLGTSPLAQVQAKEPAEFTLANRVVSLDRGFLLDIPQDRAEDLVDLWFGLTAPAPAASADPAERAIRINTFRRSQGDSAAAVKLKPSFIVVVDDDGDLLAEFIDSVGQMITARAAEIVVVDATLGSDVAAICNRAGRTLNVRRIEGHPLLTRSAARNMGAAAAAGDILIFCNPALRFEDDIVAPLLAEFSLDDLGAAGIKIREAGAGPTIHHLGVHLRPAVAGSGLQPMVTADQLDFLPAAAVPVCVPAVSDDFLVCRSNVFQAVGGFNESLSDEIGGADFCLRVRRSLREVVSFNDLDALRVAATDSGGGISDRHALPLARLVRRDLLDRPGFWAGHPPQIAIVVPAGAFGGSDEQTFAQCLATALEQVVPARVAIRAATDGHAMAEVDLLVVLDPDYDITQLTAVGPLFTAIAFAREPEGWAGCEWAQSYHGMFTDSESTGSRLRNKLARRVDVIASALVPEKPGQIPVPAQKTEGYKAALIPVRQTEAGLFDNPGGTRDGNKPTMGRQWANGPSALENAGLDDFQACARGLLARYRRLNDEVFRFAIIVDGSPADQTSMAVRTARALAHALSATGHVARIDDQSQPRPALAACDDCVIALRGRQAFAPVSGASRLLWIIDSPDLVSAAELAGYDHVFLASSIDTKLLNGVSNTPISPLLLGAGEAPDGRQVPAAATQGTLLVVGDAIDYEGECLEQALALGFKILLFGRGWSGVFPQRLIDSDLLSIAAGDRPPYDHAEFVYVPHRKVLRRFGIVAQATFEAVAAGARIVMEPVPGIERTFGSSVRTFDGKTGFAAALETWRTETIEEKAARLQACKTMSMHHSFSERARLIVDVVRQLTLQRSSGH